VNPIYRHLFKLFLLEFAEIILILRIEHFYPSVLHHSHLLRENSDKKKAAVLFLTTAFSNPL